MVSTVEIAPMLTVKEVGQLLHIHENTVRRWSDQGIIKSFRISRRGDRRFRREDIAQYVSEFNAQSSDSSYWNQMHPTNNKVESQVTFTEHTFQWPK